jgi:hypothetical protein
VSGSNTHLAPFTTNALKPFTRESQNGGLISRLEDGIHHTARIVDVIFIVVRSKGAARVYVSIVGGTTSDMCAMHEIARLA